MTLLRVFLENLLPIFLAGAAGYLLAARGKFPSRSIAAAALYVFSPCLVFDVIVKNRVHGVDFLRMAGFTLAGLLSLAVVAILVGRLARWPRSLTTALVLTVMLPNAGNFGLSASLFTFGPRGLAEASLYFITASITTYTLGVFVASMGRAPLRQSLLGLVSMPAVWAVPLAFAIVHLDLTPPTPLWRTVELLSAACIPCLLIVLGMQFHGVAWDGRHLAPMGLAVGLRLGASIAAAFLFASLFRLEGPARQAGILQAAMPSAVVSTILAVQYDVEPSFVTTVVMASTLLSPLTLTLLIAYLTR
jgi:malate permease and related proteins